MNNRAMLVMLALVLSGCDTFPLTRAAPVTEAECTQACTAHFQQCPQVFAAFPERGAIECPLQHEQCLKTCGATPGNVAKAPAPAAAPASVSTPASKEAALRELKQFHDQGLISDEVYVERQKAILSEPQAK